MSGVQISSGTLFYKEKDMQFRVKFKAELPNGKVLEGIEEEASWFLIDQRGNFYSHSPMKPITPCDKAYKELIPLIKIGEEYLTIKEIEERLK
jgi:hypothetical protein